MEFKTIYKMNEVEKFARANNIEFILVTEDGTGIYYIKSSERLLFLKRIFEDYRVNKNGLYYTSVNFNQLIKPKSDKMSIEKCKEKETLLSVINKIPNSIIITENQILKTCNKAPNNIINHCSNMANIARKYGYKIIDSPNKNKIVGIGVKEHDKMPLIKFI